jgi:hypothetical protein
MSGFRRQDLSSFKIPCEFSICFKLTILSLAAFLQCPSLIGCRVKMCFPCAYRIIRQLPGRAKDIPTHRVDRVLSFFSSRSNWVLSHHSHAGECVHSLACEGVRGGGPNYDEGTDTVVHYVNIYVLCAPTTGMPAVYAEIALFFACFKNVRNV